ncbi:hypothetical protein FO519_001241 [Halicephalobus sp. NKZ332]|nr:hypothetical protein FO519_001241 [Halicephalobus sp. NKZ332]
MDFPRITESIINIIVRSSIIINILYLVFLVHEFRIPNSPIRSSYFALLMIGMVVTVINSFISIGVSVGIYADWFIILLCISNWYSQNELGIWTLILGWNRCTALLSPKIHSKVALTMFIDYPKVMFVLVQAVSIFFFFHHYPGLIIIPIVSRTFRTRFFQFYHISHLIQKHKPPDRNKPVMTTRPTGLTLY